MGEFATLDHELRWSGGSPLSKQCQITNNNLCCFKGPAPRKICPLLLYGMLVPHTEDDFFGWPPNVCRICNTCTTWILTAEVRRQSGSQRLSNFHYTTICACWESETMLGSK